MKRNIASLFLTTFVVLSGCSAQTQTPVQTTITTQSPVQTTIATQTPVQTTTATPVQTSEETATQNTEKVHDPSAAVTDAATALTYLKDGNDRFVNNKGINRNTNENDRNILKDGQKPFAVVVTCSDSRDVPEIYFDQKLGDIFVIRNAGNISDTATLGSIEYAVEHLKSPLVVVVGHSKCGAVTAAVNGGEYPENLGFIVDTIKESIGEEKDVDKAINENIDSVVEQIKADTVINNGSTTIVGAHYDIESGKITFEQ